MTASFAEITIGWLAIGAVIVLDLIKNADASKPPVFNWSRWVAMPISLLAPSRKSATARAGTGPVVT